MDRIRRSSMWVAACVSLVACGGHALPDTWHPLVVPLASGDTLALGAPAPEGAAARRVALRSYTPAANSGFVRVEAGTDSTGRVVLLLAELKSAGATARRLRARYGPPRENWFWGSLEHWWAPTATTQVRATYPDSGGVEVFAFEPGRQGPVLRVSRVLPGPDWLSRPSVGEQVCLRGYPELCP